MELVEREDPTAADGQAVIEVAACGVCGSDLHSFSHGLAVRPGSVLGHEFCGRVVSAPGVTGLDVGDRVAVRPLIPCGECDRCHAGQLQLCEGSHADDIGYGSPGAFADRVLVPRAVVGLTVFRLPPEVDDAGGALVEPLAVAVHAVGLADVDADDVVLVLGAGTIGLAVTRLLRLAGVRTLVVAELSDGRRRRALALGADRVIDPGAEDVTRTMRSITGPGGYGLGARADVVFECAGAVPALASALKSVRQGGTIVLAGIYGREVGIHVDRIIEKEVRVQGTVAYGDEFPTVIDHLAGGAMEPGDFVSHTYALDEITQAFHTQLDRTCSLKVQVRPRPGIAQARPGS
jgi:2-desacetyl-2-hydroxyethyl bacteriochlorophyllide A dehydrogenase